MVPIICSKGPRGRSYGQLYNSRVMQISPKPNCLISRNSEAILFEKLKLTVDDKLLICYIHVSFRQNLRGVSNSCVEFTWNDCNTTCSTTWRTLTYSTQSTPITFLLYIMFSCQELTDQSRRFMRVSVTTVLEQHVIAVLYNCGYVEI